MKTKLTYILLTACILLGTSTGFAKEVRTESEMLAESVQYLHKAGISLEKENGNPSNVRRVAPITTVITGLLDAGISPNEPLVRSGLDFLAKFYAEQKKRKNAFSADEKNLLKQIAACLKKAKSHDKRKPFLADNELPGSGPLLISAGNGRFFRVRDANQPSVKNSIPTEFLATNPLTCDLLIARAHGLKSFPTPIPFQPETPRHHEWAVAFYVPVRSHKEELTTDFSASVSFCEAAEIRFDATTFNRFESDYPLLSDQLYAIRTTRRLE